MTDDKTMEEEFEQYMRDKALEEATDLQLLEEIGKRKGNSYIL